MKLRLLVYVAQELVPLCFLSALMLPKNNNFSLILHQMQQILSIGGVKLIKKKKKKPHQHMAKSCQVGD